MRVFINTYWPMALFFAIALPLLPACNSSSSTPTPAAAKTDDVVIAQAGNVFVYAPLYVAVDGGFFEDQGLKVRLITTGGDEKTWAAVIRGDAQFGVADPTFVAVSAQRGQPGKVVASILDEVPFWGVALDPTVPIVSTPHDLNSFTVGTFPAPSTAYTLQETMFKKGNLTPHIRQGAFGNLLPMLESGDIDIALELEPNVSQAVGRGARIVYSLNKMHGTFATTGLTTTEELIESDPHLVASVVRGLQEALLFIRSNKEEAASIMKHRFPELEPTTVDEALSRLSAESIFADSVVTSKIGWNQAIALRVEAGDLTKTGEFASYVDNSFAEKAVAQATSVSPQK